MVFGMAFGGRVLVAWRSGACIRCMACSGSMCLLRGVRGRASARGNRGRVSCVMYCVVGAPCVALGVSCCVWFRRVCCFLIRGGSLFLDSEELAALAMWENVSRCVWFGDGRVWLGSRKCFLLRWFWRRCCGRVGLGFCLHSVRRRRKRFCLLVFGRAGLFALRRGGICVGFG